MTRIRTMLQKGFTLIEVLLALSVFALAFGLILETLGSASRNVRVAGNLGKVALLAQNRLDTIGVDSEIKPGVTSASLERAANAMSDNVAAQQVQKARKLLFQSINRRSKSAA